MGHSTAESLFPRRMDFNSPVKPYSPAANADFALGSLNSDPQLPVAAAAAAADTSPFFDRGVDPELSLRMNFRRIGAGLANLGNTCFLNSVLQCLTYTEPFAAYLQSGKHKSSCHTSGFCAMCALQNHVLVALQSSGKILSPLHLVKNLRFICRNFGNSSQEDAHEYMVNLLESMHKCCIPSGIPLESPSAYEKSLVHKVFGGRLRSQVKCTQCSFSSNKFDPFLDLSLEIVKADSLRKALFNFIAVEQLDGGERQYNCQRCKEKVRALKQLTIHKAPNVLTIHLKRFDSYVLGKKVNKRVEFVPTLDLRPFERDLNYTLYGVLVHAGPSIHSGHYYCYVRTSSGTWHSLDDMKVSQVGEKVVLAQKAYMLFYVRNRNPMAKKSEQLLLKHNFGVNASRAKVVSLSATMSSVAVQTSSARTVPTLESSSVNMKVRGCSDIMSSSLKVSLCNNPANETASSLQNKDGGVPNGDPVLKISSQNIAGETICSQVNNNSISIELQQATSEAVTVLKVPALSLAGGAVQHAVLNLTLPDDNDSSVSAARHRNDTLDSHSSIRKYDPFGSHNREKSLRIIINPTNPAFGVASENDTEKILKQNHLNENATAIDENLHNGEFFKIVCDEKPTENKLDRLVNESECSKASTQKEASGTPTYHQSVGHKNERDPYKPQPLEKRFTKLNDPRMINYSVRKSSADNLVGKKVPAETGKTKHPTEYKIQKFTKCPRKSLYFGRRHLFYSYLMVLMDKSKKCRRSKKWRLRSANVLKVDVIDEQSTSTSETAENVIAVSKCCCKKHRHSCLKMENSNPGINSGAVDTTTNRIDGISISTSKLSIKVVDTTIQCMSREPNANDISIHQDDFMNLLTRGSKNFAVGIDLPKAEPDAFADSVSSIGFGLDKWDVDYDRREKKKMKKSRQCFDQANLYQKTGNLKEANQKSKVNLKRSGNQPYRI